MLVTLSSLLAAAVFLSLKKTALLKALKLLSTRT